MSPLDDLPLVPLSRATLDPRSRGRDVAAQFEGLVFAQALAPLATSCGLLGGAIVELAATDVARRDGGALGDTLARAVESSRRDEPAR